MAGDTGNTVEVLVEGHERGWSLPLGVGDEQRIDEVEGGEARVEVKRAQVQALVAQAHPTRPDDDS